jgi:hypothetical protein
MDRPIEWTAYWLDAAGQVAPATGHYAVTSLHGMQTRCIATNRDVSGARRKPKKSSLITNHLIKTIIAVYSQLEVTNETLSRH